MKTSGKYILDEAGEPVAEADLLTWSRWFEDGQKKGTRIVLREKIGDSEVSTVFLGMEHNFGAPGPPVLWETMVFGGALDEEQDRCSGAREQALAMHARMVQRVKESFGCGPDPP